VFALRRRGDALREEQRHEVKRREDRDGQANAIDPLLPLCLERGVGRPSAHVRIVDRRPEVSVRDEGNPARELPAPPFS